MSGTVDVSDRPARQLGTVSATIAAAMDVSDRAGRLLGVISGTVAISNASIPVTGTFWQSTQPVSIAAAMDVSDRAGRLLGVVSGTVAISNALALDATVATMSGKLPATVGQKAMAASLPVVLASDQSSIPVTGTFWQSTQPVSGTVAISTALALDATVATMSGKLPAALVGARLDCNVGAWLGSTAPTVGAKTSANSVPIVIASDQAAIPVTPPTLTKGTQGATGFATQDLKDSGRVNICWTAADQALTANTETLITTTESRDGATASTFTSKVITSGKRLRITSITAYAEMGGSTPVVCRVSLRLRFNTAGAATIASPLQVLIKLPLLAATAKTIVTQFEDFPDGIEFLGDGTKQLAFTVLCPEWVTTTVLPTISFTVFGYEY